MHVVTTLVRFIVRNGVSILEAVGEYDNVKYKDMGDKKLASLVRTFSTTLCKIYFCFTLAYLSFKNLNLQK